MRVFAIHDDEIDKNNPIGMLLYYERSNHFIIELCECLDEWNAPLLFASFVKKGIFTIPHQYAKLWVEERVIPSGRQNIGMILKNAKLTKYDECKLLWLSRGKSSQDSCYLKDVKEEEIPGWLVARQADNIYESFPYMDGRIICLLKNDTSMEVDLTKCIDDVPKLYSVIKNERLMSGLTVDSGGYGITFNGNIFVEKRILVENGVVLPIYAKVFDSFAKHCVINTTEACDILECTRQNLGYFVKQELLHPIKTDWKENVFLKGEVTSST
ncbi:hypothetical protein [Pseudobutyrivibrio ruminis]|uniref:Uncharacterized protein n=1 Tax=Pseudobutyrivibrio ruminis DSM 9787 TaxID=1123011 RepID=A0A285RRS4_9FIRM|nr:hypothetical protein [Pseudobutyrivibrio ruminis]SOB96872.1 hypothetical protein SAMN02910411_1200 [Pseudobutyrivibrio ruminis DSM 9787]